VDAYLSAGPERFTGTTVTDPAVLRDEIAVIRGRGWSSNRGEWRADVSAVAAAVLGDRGGAVASISVNVPTSRMTDEACARFGAEVVRAAAELSERLGVKS
jgi:DNA-binding IclR family transcriptional regulator